MLAKLSKMSEKLGEFLAVVWETVTMDYPAQWII